MDNEHFDEFGIFVRDLQTGDSIEKPRSIAEIAAGQPKPMDAAALLEQHKRDIDRPRERDPFAVDEVVAQERIRREMAKPTLGKSVAEPVFSSPARPEPGDLSYLIGLDQVEAEGDPALPSIMGNNHEPQESPTMVFAKGAGGSRESFLNQPLDKVLEAVASRSTGRAREFALDLAKQAAESEAL
jgi:hypothetical protein